eukprot:SAG31_NODE_20717_length_567_cov_0.771368_1_plen_46_part_01
MAAALEASNFCMQRPLVLTALTPTHRDAVGAKHSGDGIPRSASQRG